MEQLKKNLSKLIEHSKTTLHQLYCYFKTSVNVRIQQKEANYKQLLIENKHQKLSACLWNMTNDLYAVFKEKRYPFVHSLHQPSDIMPWHYRITDTGVLYYYKILAMDVIDISILMQIKEKMNHDIYTTAQELLRYYSPQDCQLLYPFLYSGIYIMGIEQDKSFFIITVATHFNPQ